MRAPIILPSANTILSACPVCPTSETDSGIHAPGIKRASAIPIT